MENRTDKEASIGEIDKEKKHEDLDSEHNSLYSVGKSTQTEQEDYAEPLPSSQGLTNQLDKSTQTDQRSDEYHQIDSASSDRTTISEEDEASTGIPRRAMQGDS